MQEEKPKETQSFRITEPGTSYQIPKFRVLDGIGIRKVEEIIFNTPEEFKEFNNSFLNLVFVRGDKSDNGELIPRVDGILPEQLIAALIHALGEKNKDVESLHTETAIMNLKCALNALELRQLDRQNRGVLGTYQK